MSWFEDNGHVRRHLNSRILEFKRGQQLPFKDCWNLKFLNFRIPTKYTKLNVQRIYNDFTVAETVLVHAVFTTHSCSVAMGDASSVV